MAAIRRAHLRTASATIAAAAACAAGSCYRQWDWSTPEPTPSFYAQRVVPDGHRVELHVDAPVGGADVSLRATLVPICRTMQLGHVALQQHRDKSLRIGTTVLLASLVGIAAGVAIGEQIDNSEGGMLFGGLGGQLVIGLPIVLLAPNHRTERRVSEGDPIAQWAGDDAPCPDAAVPLPAAARELEVETSFLQSGWSYRYRVTTDARGTAALPGVLRHVAQMETRCGDATMKVSDRARPEGALVEGGAVDALATTPYPAAQLLPAASVTLPAIPGPSNQLGFNGLTDGEKNFVQSHCR